MKKRTTDEAIESKVNFKEVKKAKKGILVTDDAALRRQSIDAYASIIASILIKQLNQGEI